MESLEAGPYLRLIARTHPALQLSLTRLPLPSFLTRLELSDPLLPGPSRDRLRRLGRRLPELLRPRALFLGSPFEPYEQSALLNQVADPWALARAVREVARAEGARLALLTNVSASHPRLSAWERAGFIALPSFPDTVLPLGQDASLEAHLRHLPPGDRSGIRRNIRRFERAGFTLERMTESAAEAGALYRAYLPFRQRAVVHWIAHTTDYFRQLPSLGEAVQLTVARDPSGALAGFIINLIAAGRVQCGRIGVAPRFHRRHAVYFRLLYHAMDQALAHGATADPGAWLSLEPTAYRLKRHLGLHLKPLVNLVLGVSPSWRLGTARLQGPARALLSHLHSPSKLEHLY